MESTENILPFCYIITFSHGVLFLAAIHLVFLLKRSINGLLRKDNTLQLSVERYEAKIAELNLQNERLQDELLSSRSSQSLTEQENKQLKDTITTLERQKKDMEDKIKHLSKNLPQSQQTHAGPNEMVAIQIEMESSVKEPKVERKVLEAQDKLPALQHKILELEYKETYYKTRIAALEITAHKRLMKSSALQRQLMDKRTEVFFLHHRLMEYMDWVAELRRTPFFAPLPLYSHNQKPTHKRVRDSWRPFLTQTHLHLIPEEKEDFAQKMEPRMALTNPASFSLY